jgi:RND family efflux transporter MFP subunit
MDKISDPPLVNELNHGKLSRARPRPVRLIYFAVGLIVLSAFGALVVFRWPPAISPQKKAPAAVRLTPALAITSATAHRLTWPVTLEASGSIAAWQEASIGAQIGGYQLIEVNVNVGDRVKKGQVLARFDPALLKANETLLQANYDQAEANRQRAEFLKNSKAMSDQDLLQYITQAKTTSASLASNQLQLRYTDVIAPDDGTISARPATLGAVIPVGQELFRMILRDRIEWRGELTATQFVQVMPGQQIQLSLPDGSDSRATVREIAPSLDPHSRMGIVYADIDPGSHARAGMYANGKLILGEKTALAVPAASVVVRDGNNYVLILQGTGETQKVALQPVAIGRRQGTDIEITQSLADGQRVVVEGAGFLNDGDIVRVVPSQSTTPDKP